jgi:hypothetical protein
MQNPNYAGRPPNSKTPVLRAGSSGGARGPATWSPPPRSGAYASEVRPE